MNGRVIRRPAPAIAGLNQPGELSWNQPPNPNTPTPPTRVPHDQDVLRNEESRWIEAAQAGDREAFAKIVEHYWDRLYRWLFHLTRNRHQAEDLVQETFMKSLAAIGSFRIGSNFRAWLFRIGHNNFVNLKRSERRTKMSLPDEMPNPVTIDPLTTMGDREAVSEVAKAVNDLPPEFRSALLLHTQEGLSYREIANILKTTEETARWRVFKARQKLIKVLAPELVPASSKDSEKE